ncbi:MAG: glutamine-hydrolyzing carbamoyl-phosphate synthase small subunit [Nanoarchaeota archaeon]|nr:glutamine-hydrolyzing carbamoyl-phosphate synthase small subunit [Nanoarchaeota archaeon]
MYAILALKDGTIFKGKGFGSPSEAAAEVVFNTSLVGYEESLTDPSYRGQILCLTYPLIGNYGVRRGLFESDRIQVEGFVVREMNTFNYHRNSIKDINTFLEEHSIPGICEIDTRLLTKKIREQGVMNGALLVSKNEITDDDIARIKNKATSLDSISGIDLLKNLGVNEPKLLKAQDAKATIALVDLGVKMSIVRNLLNKGLNVLMIPGTTKPDQFEDYRKEYRIKGLFISNGPGDPENATDAIKLVREMQSELPIAGICFGNQIIGLAMGGKTYKLKFGHRGANQPVQDIRTKKVYITSQNHGFAVDNNSLEGTGMEVSMINLNDNSVEGMKHKNLPIQSVQFHPEANPGPWDCIGWFDEIKRMFIR